MKASPLSKISMEIKKEISSSSCVRNLFAEVSNNNGGSKDKGKGVEVENSTTNIVSATKQQGLRKTIKFEKPQCEVESVS